MSSCYNCSLHRWLTWAAPIGHDATDQRMHCLVSLWVTAYLPCMQPFFCHCPGAMYVKCTDCCISVVLKCATTCNAGVSHIADYNVYWQLWSFCLAMMLTFMKPTLSPLLSWHDKAGPRMKLGRMVTRSKSCSLAIFHASLSADACSIMHSPLLTQNWCSLQNLMLKGTAKHTMDQARCMPCSTNKLHCSWY